MVILEERSIIHTQCPLYNMLVLWRSLNGLHKSTAYCKKGAERKRWRLATEEARAVTSRAFSSYGLPIKMVPYFKYLGRVLLEADDD